MRTVFRLLLAAFLIAGGNLFARWSTPGGVLAPALRLGAPPDNNPGTLYDHVSRKTVLTRQAGVTLNGNPSVYLNSNDTLPSVALASPECFTFIAVYSRSDTSEYPLFSLQSGDSAILLATAARLAELKDAAYLNYEKSRRHGIYLYSRRKNYDSLNADNLLLRIARRPNEKLPVTAYQGAMPEAILYNRILTLSERRRIQSYLSLKYGISLEQDVFPNSYYSASGEELWDASRLSAHSVRITGIGRDDLSGLLQIRSTNAEDNYQPVVTLNQKQVLPDKTFLLWGDNGKPLRMNRQQGMPARLERQWLTRTTGDMTNLSTRLDISTVHFEELPEKGKTYWLAVDRSGTGRFPVGQTTYKRCDTYEKSTATFRNLYWDTSDAVFTIMQASDFFVRSEVEQGYCQPVKNGSIVLQCVGGKSPYRVVLEKDGKVLYRHTVQDSLYAFSSLTAARYGLTVTDAAGRIYRDTLYLTDVDAPQIILADTYTLTNGAAEIAPRISSEAVGSYAWERAGTTVGRNLQLKVTTPGTYTLTVRNAEGCTGMAQTQVTDERRSCIRHALLYPNPTADGRFYLRIHLADPAPVTVNIYDVQGRSIRQKTLSRSADFHVYEGREPRPGIYLIGIHSGGESLTVKLIVD